MKKIVLYSLVLGTLLSACEDIYNPDIDTVDNMVVVDARLVSGNSNNKIKMYNTRGFQEKPEFAGITGALISIVSDDGKVTVLDTVREGSTYVNLNFTPGEKYKLKIEYQGDTYESDYEQVPVIPRIDTVYGIAETKITRPDGSNNTEDFTKKEGVQLYADISNESVLPYYRFTARRVLQYTYPVNVKDDLTETMYGWESFFPHEQYTIAAPAEYSSSTDIIKAPLYFLPKKMTRRPEHTFAGWIMLIQQYAISQNAYRYYKDLNSLLGSEGRLFDPVYVQARNNLKCTSDPNKTILGNFELAAGSESRYFVKHNSFDNSYLVKKIPYFYSIPYQGEQLSIVPVFWESPSKTYPDE